MLLLLYVDEKETHTLKKKQHAASCHPARSVQDIQAPPFRAFRDGVWLEILGVVASWKGGREQRRYYYLWFKHLENYS